MTAAVAASVLFAAVLHASWNAVLRGGRDRLVSTGWMCLAIGLVSTAALPFVPQPAQASWPCIAASTLIHIAYSLFLARAYRTADLGQAYPVARGISPVLVALGAAIFAGELLKPEALIGVIVVSAGILALAGDPRRVLRRGSPMSATLITGVLIAVYTVVDGVGARLSTAPVSYALWMFAPWGLITAVVVYAIAINRRSSLSQPAKVDIREALAATAGGVISLLAYALVIWALARAPMGAISALRETSVVFAALLGRFVLNETLTARRIIACLGVACGAALIGIFK